MNPLKHTLPEPDRHSNIPETAQWLSGEGAGSWFHIELKDKLLKIARYSPDGIVECEGIFKNNSKNTFDINQTYQITHLSHCQQVSIVQDGKSTVLIRT